MHYTLINEIYRDGTLTPEQKLQLVAPLLEIQANHQKLESQKLAIQANEQKIEAQRLENEG
ncbi:hypothetical protein HK104_006621, partial [Borealophlyctis nickersoniae]